MQDCFASTALELNSSLVRAIVCLSNKQQLALIQSKEGAVVLNGMEVGKMKGS